MPFFAAWSIQTVRQRAFLIGVGASTVTGVLLKCHYAKDNTPLIIREPSLPFRILCNFIPIVALEPADPSTPQSPPKGGPGAWLDSTRKIFQVDRMQEDVRRENDFISKMFSLKSTLPTMPKINIPEPHIPSVEEINQRMNELYPTFASQFDTLRESYEHFWDFLTMEDFRKLIDDIQREDQDGLIYPEVGEDAIVREGSGLSKEEKKFIKVRKERQRQSFAKFMRVDPHEVELEDMPIVGIASSGGGYRAMAGCAGYLKGMRDTGVLDCVMYMAGVSGSCWTMALYYSPLSGGSLEKLSGHLQTHMHTHLANVSSFLTVLSASKNNAKLLMQGVLERYYQQNNTLNVVDVFGMLIGATLLTKKKIDNTMASESSECQDHSIDTEGSSKKKEDILRGIVTEEDGTQRKPILLSKNAMKLSCQDDVFGDGSQPMPIYCAVRHDNAHTAEEEKDIYQWYEFTPFEMGCEEIDAWIPMWGFGRKFDQGKNLERLPEQSLDIMMGVFGSAFAASLVQFYQEVRSFLPKRAIDASDEIVLRYQESMSNYHPISPASFPNPFYNLPEYGPIEEGCTFSRPKSLIESKELCLMDAGMDNNIPFYPLLRQGRDVDVILAVDLSADIQTAHHFDRAEGYAKRRGVKGWPVDAGWPKQHHSSKTNDYPLGTCTVFASHALETETEEATGETYQTKAQRVTVVYFPFILNKAFDPEFDPQTAEFCSTWNFVYTSDQVNKLEGLAEKNWTENIDQVREVLRKVWDRKRRQRLEKLPDIENPFTL
ncbi:acyl transferase/acyl hydrolase/lysophospholipase [Phycomyces blakesleeanus]|uniref:Lysophospholipase n=1 Tax=Phycomyces blakesleeanus TaxID=4837 RepID=A0ABR3BBR4_PHYBL